MIRLKNFFINQETNDFEFDGNGDIKQIAGTDEIAQQINRTLTTRQGEWFLNTGFGLNWDIVFDKPYREQKVKAEIQRAILAVDGVEDIERLSLSYNSLTRRLQVSFIAYTNEGNSVEGVTALG